MLLSAFKLDNFSCYGVDSYNLYHECKISNLQELARYYLSQIDEIMQKTNQKTYHLLGWSLGGQIALEIAGILEERNQKYIQIYLLDTVLNDYYLINLRKSINMINLKKEYKDFLYSSNYDEFYIEKSLANMEVENELIMQSPSIKLDKSFAVLFKAMLIDTRFKVENFKKISEYSFNLKYNNVNKIFTKKSHLKLICANNVHHGNILQEEELLISSINNFADRNLFPLRNFKKIS